MALRCAPSETFNKVEFASFGTPSGFKKGDCDAANTTAWVASLCVGQSQCTLPPDSTVRDTHSPLVQALGDPCEGTEKQLAVVLGGCSAAPPPPAPPLPVRLQGKGMSLMFDWGQETGGFSTLNFGDASDSSQSVSLAYSESSFYWVGGDNSNGGKGADGTISTGAIAPNAPFTPPAAHMRGGFRYLHLVLETDGWVDVRLPSVHFTATPNMADPSAWANHFFCSDDLLNRIWYAAGFTTQMCSIDPKHGRAWPPPASGWDNSASCGEGDSVLVDGAKRDRIIWPGDMGVSSLTAIATTGDLDASRNSANTLYKYQLPSGMLPYAGPPVSSYGHSDTYHLWALIGTYNIAKHDADDAWLRSVWEGFQKGVAASAAKVSAKGLFRVDQKADWQRHGQGGENCPANMLYYRALTAAAELAGSLGNASLAASYTARAASLQAAVVAHLWDDDRGAFFDNTNNHGLFPQDGNSLAAWFGVVDSARAARISDYLRSNWGEYGSASPEWDGNIGTFPGSMETHAHAAVGNASRAHELMRLQWGYMLGKPESTQSTFWEGFNADGSFNFQGIYMSNAHSWASGPAAALTAYTLGLRATSVGGARYTVAPRFGGLAHCRGRLSFGRGRHVDAAWNVSAAGVTLAVDSSAHAGSWGLLTLDLAGLDGGGRPLDAVRANGAVVWARGRALCADGPSCGDHAFGAARVDGGVVSLHGVRPQQLTLTLSFTTA
jgi:hypothetical protein